MSVLLLYLHLANACGQAQPRFLLELLQAAATFQLGQPPQAGAEHATSSSASTSTCSTAAAESFAIQTPIAAAWTAIPVPRCQRRTKPDPATPLLAHTPPEIRERRMVLVRVLLQCTAAHQLLRL